MTETTVEAPTAFPVQPAPPVPQENQPMSEQELRAKLKNKALFVATPMYGGNCNGVYARSIADLAAICRALDIPLQLYFLFNESLITRARNYCCDEFMRSSATHLMFIDSDIGFDARDVVNLMLLATDESEYDIIGGAYPKKCISWEKIRVAVDKGFADKNPNDLEKFVGDYVFNLKGNNQTIPVNQPAEVLELGTGFMMIRRRTLEKFADRFAHLSYRPDHVRTEHFDGSREIMMFFQAETDNTDFRTIYLNVAAKLKDTTDLEKIKAILKEAEDVVAVQKSKRYLSEDYWFCQKIQEIGLKTWLCPWMKLQHVGSFVFGGSLADIAALGVTATADAGVLEKGKTRQTGQPSQQPQKKRN